MEYDVIIIGGGMAGATLAKRLAEQKIRTLVVEREYTFRDRVRGEGILPWGVTEAKALGIYDLLRDGCGHEVQQWNTYSGASSSVITPLLQPVDQPIRTTSAGLVRIVDEMQ